MIAHLTYLDMKKSTHAIPPQVAFRFDFGPFYEESMLTEFDTINDLQTHFAAIVLEKKALSLVVDSAYNKRLKNAGDFYAGKQITHTGKDVIDYTFLHNRVNRLSDYWKFLLWIGQTKFNYWLNNDLKSIGY